MRVLVTGNLGFVGQWLTKELESAGWDVFGHDLIASNRDLTEPGAFKASLDYCKPHQVVHLAAQVGRLFGEEDLSHTIASNSIMTALVAHACGAAEVPVLYSSTSEVYGDQGAATCSEDGPTVLPHNAYGLSKADGEDWLRLYAPNGLKIVRLSMPAGPGAPPGRGRRALDNFLWQAHHGMPIPVHRGAERSWCHVADTVRGIRWVMEYSGQEIYNVGRDDNPVSMLELARKCCDLAGASHDLIQEIDPPAAQTVVKRLDTSRLRALGWAPQFELEDILSETYEWVKQFDSEGRLVAPVA